MKLIGFKFKKDGWSEKMAQKFVIKNIIINAMRHNELEIFILKDKTRKIFNEVKDEKF
jgi:hypothetical protein